MDAPPGEAGGVGRSRRVGAPIVRGAGFLSNRPDAQPVRRRLASAAPSGERAAEAWPHTTLSRAHLPSRRRSRSRNRWRPAREYGRRWRRRPGRPDRRTTPRDARRSLVVVSITPGQEQTCRPGSPMRLMTLYSCLVSRVAQRQAMGKRAPPCARSTAGRIASSSPRPCTWRGPSVVAPAQVQADAVRVGC